MSVDVPSFLKFTTEYKVLDMTTLYSKSKTGKVRYWSIAVEQQGDEVFIVRHTGEEGGKDQEFRKEVTSGKNIGRKNETTKLQQAQLETASMLKKQKDAGFVENSADLEKVVNLLPMLANKWEDRHKYIPERFYIQPKLDGVRMLIGKYNGRFVMVSRTGKEVKHMDHIGDEIKDFLNEGDFLDGENYSPDKTFEEIAGLCRTSLKSSAEGKDLKSIKFHVFDMFNLGNLDQPFEERVVKLMRLFSKNNFQNLQLVETKILSDKKFVESEHDRYVHQGFEGIMVRDPMSKYLLAGRSNHLLKFKKFQTEEYKIIDATEGVGKDKGTVIWTCETQDGQPFSVRPTGTHAERQSWFKNRSKFMGKMLTVKFQNLTEYGFPRFPVGVTIRDYE